MQKDILNSESFRDSLTTVSKEGKRVWIFPKKPSGRYYNARNIVALILLAVLFITPFIKVNGHPFMLFNVLERHFIIFGVGFGPHDFYMFVLAFITIIISIVLFTAVFGRVFCGWACPQTIFMEMVFRKIEYWIDGDAHSQRKLAEAPMNGEKLFKRVLKHSVFFALSFIISNFFLAYIISMDELINIITDPPSEHLVGLTAITIFSGVFYFVFSYFREQACTIVCPYGRLQGVLLDKNSLVVAYDHVRGEPRAKLRKNEERTGGDCIDCGLCVDVCPTGIDIRNGIQLECVNCTACIDACDEVMDKIKKPRGLVRYDSQNGIVERTGFKITPRIILYTILLVLLLSLLGYFLATRSDFSVNILRTPGMMYQDQPDGKISNIYTLYMVNKTFNPVKAELKVKNFDAEIKVLGNDLDLAPQEILEGRFMIVLKKDQLDKINVPLDIAVYQNGREITTIRTAFLTHKAGL